LYLYSPFYTKIKGEIGEAQEYAEEEGREQEKGRTKGSI
jgi:hypothetical protein